MSVAHTQQVGDDTVAGAALDVVVHHLGLYAVHGALAWRHLAEVVLYRALLVQHIRHVHRLNDLYKPCTTAGNQHQYTMFSPMNIQDQQTSPEGTMNPFLDTCLTWTTCLNQIDVNNSNTYSQKIILRQQLKITNAKVTQIIEVRIFKRNF